jgi:hypothetical protein
MDDIYPFSLRVDMISGLSQTQAVFEEKTTKAPARREGVRVRIASAGWAGEVRPVNDGPGKIDQPCHAPYTARPLFSDWF